MREPSSLAGFSRNGMDSLAAMRTVEHTEERGARTAAPWKEVEETNANIVALREGDKRRGGEGMQSKVAVSEGSAGI